jgi:hypothetical protein
MKLEIEGMYFNITEATYDKPIVNFILNGEKLKPFPLKSGLDKGAHSTPTQHSFGNPS